MDLSSIETLENIHRRKLLAGTAAVAATLSTGSSLAEGHKHKHHHHSSGMHSELIESALDCIKTGEACDNHCLELVKSGDTSIAECMDIVKQMLPMCRTLASLASAESDHLLAFAQVCAVVCKDCEAECKVHADMHIECKACMESCTECIKQCEKLTA